MDYTTTRTKLSSQRSVSISVGNGSQFSLGLSTALVKVWKGIRINLGPRTTAPADTVTPTSACQSRHKARGEHAQLGRVTHQKHGHTPP